MNVLVALVCMEHARMEPMRSLVLAPRAGQEVHATHAPPIILEAVVRLWDQDPFAILPQAAPALLR